MRFSSLGLEMHLLARRAHIASLTSLTSLTSRHEPRHDTTRHDTTRHDTSTTRKQVLAPGEPRVQRTARPLSLEVPHLLSIALALKLRVPTWTRRETEDRDSHRSPRG